MLQLEDARNRILSEIKPGPAEPTPLNEAFLRVAAETVRAGIDLPSFDNSAMDGYAVQSRDIAGASAESPRSLVLQGTVAAGGVFAGKLQPGYCIRIFTGSPLPEGADAVVMQEDTRASLENPSTVTFLDTAKPWENIRLRGGDIRRDSIAIAPGETVTAGKLALLGALGVRELLTARRPIVAVMATGSELKEPGASLEPGQIFESNRLALAAMISSAGGIPRIFPLVEDQMAKTVAALEQGLAECDLLVTSGGVSVGEFDFVKSAWEKLGGELGFWKVAMQPGKPFVFGRRGDKFLFGLPGNPVSAAVTFLVLVRPAVRRWLGAIDLDVRRLRGTLAEPLVNRGDRRHFMRVVLSSEGEVRSAGVQSSHALNSWSRANGLVEAPPKTNLPEGSQVLVLPLD